MNVVLFLYPFCDLGIIPGELKMLTYDLSCKGDTPLYEYIYNCIRNDIIEGRLLCNEKLPSKRKMALNHNISIITIENAYEQLVLEGYIYAVEKKGYFVAEIEKTSKPLAQVKHEPINNSTVSKEILIDFTSNNTARELFPATTWSKLVRKNLLWPDTTLTTEAGNTGVKVLRDAIASYLQGMRGLTVNPDNIIVGAGTEYLYGLLVQILGRNGMIAVEDPGHLKVSYVYESNGVRVLHVPVDKNGLSVEALGSLKPMAIHISPSHHFPTGVVMPATRRHELVSFAREKGAVIIEDDYDSEFRFSGRPIPTLKSLDSENVIYMNTFSKTLSSAIRIAYMILPDRLMKIYREKLSFYSGTVSNIEQYTLADFISGGYYERHINRMKNFYKGYRTTILDVIRSSPLYERIQIEEENAGLHFILSFQSDKLDNEITDALRYNGVRISSVSSYCYNKSPKFTHKLIMNYSDIKKDDLKRAIEIIDKTI